MKLSGVLGGVAWTLSRSFDSLALFVELLTRSPNEGVQLHEHTGVHSPDTRRGTQELIGPPSEQTGGFPAGLRNPGEVPNAAVTSVRQGLSAAVATRPITT
jgi:hypothetical protein